MKRLRPAGTSPAPGSRRCRAGDGRPASPVIAFVRDCLRGWGGPAHLDRRHVRGNGKAGAARTVAPSSPTARRLDAISPAAFPGVVLPQAQRPRALLRWRPRCAQAVRCDVRNRSNPVQPSPRQRLYRDDRGLVAGLVRDDLGDCGTTKCNCHMGLQACTAMYRRFSPITHARGRARAHARRIVVCNGFVSRYIAAQRYRTCPHAPPYPFSLAHVGTRLAHVASLAAGWPTIPPRLGPPCGERCNHPRW